MKIAHLSTLKICCNPSLRWVHDDLMAPKSLNNLTKTVANSTLNELLLEIEFHMQMLNSFKFLLQLLPYLFPYIFWWRVRLCSHEYGILLHPGIHGGVVMHK